MNIPLSILDLVPVGTGSSSSQAFKETIELAHLADDLGYTRLWFAEHHSMPSIGSSSPEILIAHVAAKTKRIRVGSGGIMLPNHAPLRVAEAFHTLEALHPGRIDLGIGRAPGTDPAAYKALRPFDAEQFPSMLSELRMLSAGDFPKDHPFHSVSVVPDDVTLPPIWILGSSGASARFSGSLGVGYGFASHFSPTPAGPALEAYRDAFKPSAQFERPHAILAVAAVCAETKEQADYLAKTMDLSWVKLHRGEKSKLPSPEEAMNYPYTQDELTLIEQRRSLLIVGDPPTVRETIQSMAQETGADEVMISSLIHDPRARLRSYELIAEAFDLQ